MRPVCLSLISLTLGTSCLYAEELGDAFAIDNFEIPTLPEGISGTITDVEFDQNTGIGTWGGPIRLTTDNGVTLRSDRGSMHFKNETATLLGNVQVIQKATAEKYGIQIFANRADVDHKSKTVRLSGDVSLYTGEALHRGESTIYNYGTGEFETAGLRSSADPLLLESGKFRAEMIDGERVLIGEDAGISTHDVAKPHYWIRSDKTSIFPGEKVVFENLRFEIGDRTFLKLPYLTQPLDTELGYRFVPGARSNLGPFLLNEYSVLLGGEKDERSGEKKDAHILSRWHFDLYSRRGLGLGVDFSDTRLEENPNLTGFSAYYINDFGADITRSGVPRDPVNEDRFIIRLRDKRELSDIGDFAVSAFSDLNWFSDRFYLEDFQPRVFRIDPEPDNVIGLTANDGDRSVLNLYSRLQLNNFYTTDERLPEITFDQVRGPLAGTPFLHEGQTSLGVYREELADFRRDSLRAERLGLLAGDPRADEIDALLEDRGFTRFHTYQEISLPLNHEGWLQVTPRAGVGYTHYSSVRGAGSSTDRTHLYAGVDTSLTLSRAYPDVQNDRWGIDGIKHVVQPYVNASWLRTNELDESFGRIDRLTASTRPRQRGVGRFSAIDDLADWGVFRIGVRNQLLTRRDGDTHQWLTLDTYVDAFTDDPELGRSLSNLYNSVRWEPVPWIRLNFDTQFPLIEGGSGFSEVVTGATFMPTDDLEFQVRHRYLNNHPILLDSNQIDMRLFARISDLWGFDFYHRWELDDSTLEVQQYQIYRDLGSWTVGAGLSLRDNREQDEYAFLLTFNLKEFPSVNLPLSIDNE